MRRLALAPLAVALIAAPAAPAVTRVQMMVVGQNQTLMRARQVALKAGRVKIGHRHCSVPSRTALSGLLASHLSLRVSDVAGCDPASMFVKGVDHEANRGQAGWEYKVGRRSPSFGAGDPGGRLHSGEQLLWFWCLTANACQRTLAVKAHVSGNVVKIQVTGYDDNGHGRATPAASVHIGARTLLTNSHGSVTTTVAPGAYQVYAVKSGTVGSFPVKVGVAA
jgi:hypothetical protein